MYVVKRDGSKELLDIAKIQRAVQWACAGLNVSQSDLETSARLPLYDGIKTKDIQIAFILAASDKISPTEPDWTYVAARLLLQTLYKQANDGSIHYPTWSAYASNAISKGLMTDWLNDDERFDLAAIDAVIDRERDFHFDYLGLQTLADRYLLKDENDVVIELPQHMLMRVAMGVALNEQTRELRTQYAIDYYRLYSARRALNSTPTLFNSGTLRPQLSSCFGTFIGDSLDGIMDGLKEIAQYSKYSGGCSVDMGSVRATGSRIGSTKGKAGGPIPYLKMYNDTLIGFDQSGKRKGSGSAYIEPWHADIFRYLDLREPGDEHLRAHDIFPALWIPDLFMERLERNEKWSLFDPKQVPMLHETYGDEFNRLYHEAEAAGLAIEQVDAEDIWYKILDRLFSHGVFWPCWKDTVNHRYAQPEIVHQSNLCTEITLRNDDTHSFVCNLGSVNLANGAHLLVRDATTGKFLWNANLEKTVRLMVRNLDSVISVGMVPHENGARMQQEDRPIGLGVMGWTEALYAMGIDYESPEHIQYANEVMKQISLTAIDESANLAQELGSYPTFHKSTWAQGKLPVDSLRHDRVVKQFDLDIYETNAPFGTMNDLREKVKRGMRNSTLLAIAPTATIANIIGTTQATELPWQEIFTKKNLSGTFKYLAHTVVNNPFKLPFKSTRNINQLWTVWAAAARQIWVDQAQSINYFLSDLLKDDEIGDSLDNMYRESWKCGNKTSYYLYGQAEENEVQLNPSMAAHADPTVPVEPEETGGRFCSIDAGPDCEACQ